MSREVRGGLEKVEGRRTGAFTEGGVGRVELAGQRSSTFALECPS